MLCMFTRTISGHMAGLIECTKLSQFHLISPSSVLERETLDIYYTGIFPIFASI